MIRVILPYHLQLLSKADSEVALDIPGEVTPRAVVDALEGRYPMLIGTVRDPATGQRRPFLRFFACERDLSHMPMDALLPDSVVAGTEPLIILGAVAGG